MAAVQYSFRMQLVYLDRLPEPPKVLYKHGTIVTGPIQMSNALEQESPRANNQRAEITSPAQRPMWENCEIGRDECDPLPPRVRPVLRQLLAGKSEKEIAAGLRLSPHTVHTYVKIIYRRLQVRSRGELLARWVNFEE